ncbi:MAG TPA: hypothetical protein VIV07_07750, partial [Sphingomicrobium sp.]
RHILTPKRLDNRAKKPTLLDQLPRGRLGGVKALENDSIRASGNTTLVDIWVEGKLRAISIGREAIESYLGLPPDKAAAMSEGDRCEFVRTHMSLVIAAVKDRLRETGAAADSVEIAADQLWKRGGARQTERRKGERRKTDRRTASRPDGKPDRRRSQRRKGERRAPTKDADKS